MRERLQTWGGTRQVLGASTGAVENVKGWSGVRCICSEVREMDGCAEQVAGVKGRD
jgi:hypothetical protein